MPTRADAEIEMGLGNAQLIKENVRHSRIIVLPRMDNDLLDAQLTGGSTDRPQLYELGPGANDGENLQREKLDDYRSRQVSGPKSLYAATETIRFSSSQFASGDTDENGTGRNI